VIFPLTLRLFLRLASRPLPSRHPAFPPTPNTSEDPILPKAVPASISSCARARVTFIILLAKGPGARVFTVICR
jgi:hypothetical protein